ncbi:MAG: hypothetical protein WAV04_01000 [Candidatus Microsaccharimonas sp.]
MSEEETTMTDEEMTFWAKHRFMLLIFCTIVLALILTVISVSVYNLSGAAQLDLSRPGYQSVSDQVETNNSIQEYSPFGAVNKTTVDEFTKIYDEQAAKAKAVDAFNGDPLNPEVLEFGTTTVAE